MLDKRCYNRLRQGGLWQFLLLDQSLFIYLAVWLGGLWLELLLMLSTMAVIPERQSNKPPTISAHPQAFTVHLFSHFKVMYNWESGVRPSQEALELRTSLKGWTPKSPPDKGFEPETFSSWAQNPDTHLLIYMLSRTPSKDNANANTEESLGATLSGVAGRSLDSNVFSRLHWGTHHQGCQLWSADWHEIFNSVF